MKSVIIEQFKFVAEAEIYANKKAEEGYRMVSFSNYKDMCGVAFVVCMELAKFERVGGGE